jgi:hypothetical protein
LSSREWRQTELPNDLEFKTGTLLAQLEQSGARPVVSRSDFLSPKKARRQNQTALSTKILTTSPLPKNSKIFIPQKTGFYATSGASFFV